jgi:urease accessory protein
MSIVMTDERYLLSSAALLRLQSWLSPGFPIGSYSYSHGLEWAVESGQIHDRRSLVEWLEADLSYGSGRNEAIFFSEAWRCAVENNEARLFAVTELAAVSRGTSEFALESVQQATACLGIMRSVWPHHCLDTLSKMISDHQLQPALAVVLGLRLANESIPLHLALPAFIQGYTASLVTAGVRLIPLGQTEGQLALAGLENAVLDASTRAYEATLNDLGSAAFMVELASMAHETQYTRLFRS